MGGGEVGNQNTNPKHQISQTRDLSAFNSRLEVKQTWKGNNLMHKTRYCNWTRLVVSKISKVKAWIN